MLLTFWPFQELMKESKFMCDDLHSQDCDITSACMLVRTCGDTFSTNKRTPDSFEEIRIQSKNTADSNTSEVAALSEVSEKCLPPHLEQHYAITG